MVSDTKAMTKFWRSQWHQTGPDKRFFALTQCNSFDSRKVVVRPQGWKVNKKSLCIGFLFWNPWGDFSSRFVSPKWIIFLGAKLCQLWSWKIWRSKKRPAERNLRCAADDTILPFFVWCCWRIRRKTANQLEEFLEFLGCSKLQKVIQGKVF